MVHFTNIELTMNQDMKLKEWRTLKAMQPLGKRILRLIFRPLRLIEVERDWGYFWWLAKV